MQYIALITSFTLLLSIAAAQLADALLTHRIPILGSFAGLQYGLNPGIAWGIQLPAGIQEVLIFLALVCVAYLAWKEAAGKKQEARSRQTYRLPLTAYSFILGGGLANIFDRMLDGYVTDYIQIGSFPVFNVADSFVTIGVGLLLLEAFLSKRS